MNFIVCAAIETTKLKQKTDWYFTSNVNIRNESKIMGKICIVNN